MSGPLKPFNPAQNEVSVAHHALLPPHVRRWVWGIVGSAVAFAVYVFLVRGEVLLQSLAAIAAYCF